MVDGNVQVVVTCKIGESVLAAIYFCVHILIIKLHDRWMIDVSNGQ
jgi:hypothetical protein